MGATALLPPPGTPNSEGAVAEYLNGLTRETYLRQADFNVWDRAYINHQLYLYARRQDRKCGRVRVNFIQGACDSNAALQTASAPTFFVRERSTGVPPVYYFNKAAAPPMLAGMPQTDRSLDDQHVKLLQDMIMQAAVKAKSTGQPPEISPNVLVRVDDSTIRRALNDVLADKFEAGGGVQFTREHIRYRNIYGYQFTLQGWDDREHKPTFRNMEPVCVFPDWTRTNIGEMAHVVIDDFMGKDEALADNPDPAVRKAIEEKSQGGSPEFAGNVPYVFPPYWKGKYFYREVVIVRTAWIRNQPYPLTAEEAVNAGLVTLEKVLIEPVESLAGPDGGTGGADTFTSDGVTAPVPAGPVEPLAPNTRDGYFAADGSEITFPHPQMTRTGIREIKVIAGKVVYDKECERVDFPFMHSVNIGIPFTPWGQGEPERLEYAQLAYNNVVTDIVVNGEFATTPSAVTTDLVVRDNPRLANNAYIRPGELYVVSSGTWLTLGGDRGQPMIQSITPPPTPPDQWRREEMLHKILVDVSDRSDVMRGQAPGAGASGIMVQELQQAGSNVVGYKSQGTEDALAHAAKVLVGDITTRMTPKQLAKEYPKYSEWIWTEIHNRWLNHYLYSNIDVEVTGGGINARRKRGMELLQAKQTGLSVSQPEIMESFDLDPEEQIRREAEFQTQLAMSLPQQPQQEEPQNGKQNGTPRDKATSRVPARVG